VIVVAMLGLTGLIFAVGAEEGIGIAGRIETDHDGLFFVDTFRKGFDFNNSKISIFVFVFVFG